MFFQRKTETQMGIIKDRFKEKAEHGCRNKNIAERARQQKIGEVQLAQVYQGMRGMTGLVTETSLLDAQEGIRFRGYTIPELQQKLPKLMAARSRCRKALFYLMLVGELPPKKMCTT
jgi:citrate synthase